MSELLLRWTKKMDGTVVFRCLRADGTSMWQRQKDEFFVHHDLSHYAIETTLGLRRAFYGLIASGWNVTDFGKPWPRGPIPADAMPEAGLAECLAGTLDLERANGEVATAASLNVWIGPWFERGGLAFQRLSQDEWSAVRDRVNELHCWWKALPPCEDLELVFVTEPRP
jgi:hypothetical protein